MLDWLTDNWGDLAVSALLLAAVAAILINLIRKKRAGKCSCGCSSCGGECRR